MTNMSARDQLLSYADRFLKYINTPNMDPEYLNAFLAHDVKTPLSYSGTPSGYEGISGIVEKLHGALTDFSLTVVSPVVDEKECRVVYFVKSKGVQSGEWHGVPGTGKPFEHYGFLMMQIDLKRGVIDEMSVLFQDFLFLKQIGVIPYGYG